MSTGCQLLAGPRCHGPSCGATLDEAPCEELVADEPGECCEEVTGCGDGAPTCGTTHLGIWHGIGGHVQEACYQCGDFVVAPVWGATEQLVCWPVNKVRHVVNFCAPDGCVGPPDMVGPGRFHPVPTRPVFSPVMVPAPAAPTLQQ